MHTFSSSVRMEVSQALKLNWLLFSLPICCFLKCAVSSLALWFRRRLVPMGWRVLKWRVQHWLRLAAYVNLSGFESSSRKWQLGLLTAQDGRINLDFLHWRLECILHGLTLLAEERRPSHIMHLLNKRLRIREVLFQEERGISWRSLELRLWPL